MRFAARRRPRPTAPTQRHYSDRRMCTCWRVARGSTSPSGLPTSAAAACALTSRACVMGWPRSRRRQRATPGGQIAPRGCRHRLPRMWRSPQYSSPGGRPGAAICVRSLMRVPVSMSSDEYQPTQPVRMSRIVTRLDRRIGPPWVLRMSSCAIVSGWSTRVVDLLQLAIAPRRRAPRGPPAHARPSGASRAPRRAHRRQVPVHRGCQWRKPSHCDLGVPAVEDVVVADQRRPSGHFVFESGPAEERRIGMAASSLV